MALSIVDLFCGRGQTSGTILVCTPLVALTHPARRSVIVATDHLHPGVKMAATSI
jgi:hypothetical protein